MIFDVFILCETVGFDGLNEPLTPTDNLIDGNARRDLVLLQQMWMSFPRWLAEFLFGVEPFSFGSGDFGGFVTN